MWYGVRGQIETAVREQSHSRAGQTLLRIMQNRSGITHCEQLLTTAGPHTVDRGCSRKGAALPGQAVMEVSATVLAQNKQLFDAG